MRRLKKRYKEEKDGRNEKRNKSKAEKKEAK